MVPMPACFQWKDLHRATRKGHWYPESWATPRFDRSEFLGDQLIDSGGLLMQMPERAEMLRPRFDGSPGAASEFGLDGVRHEDSQRLPAAGCHILRFTKQMRRQFKGRFQRVISLLSTQKWRNLQGGSGGRAEGRRSRVERGVEGRRSKVEGRGARVEGRGSGERGRPEG